MAGDTIFAVASGPGTAGVAVVRISGPAADAALTSLTDATLPVERVAGLRTLRDAEGGVLDHALVLRFPAGSSFTGESVVELQCHGSPAVVRAVLASLSAIPGLRVAEPGEFTRRAFESGRMDLVEVEALGDLIAAETEIQRRRALAAPGLIRVAETWREDLVGALALTELTIDWVDEEVPQDVFPEVTARLGRVLEGIRVELAGADAAERLRTGYEVAILGAPNAGKSTLFNALAARDAAITSAVPGTTRDVLELRYDLRGLPVTFLDTAGLRDAPGEEIEAQGIGRAVARAQAADLRIFVAAPDAPLPAAEVNLREPGDIDLWNKTDTGEAGPGLPVSALTGAGLKELLDRLHEVLQSRSGEASLVTHRRQRDALARALPPLEEAILLAGSGETELVADALRRVCSALDEVVGRIGVETVLDEVFGRFCLGK